MEIQVGDKVKILRLSPQHVSDIEMDKRDGLPTLEVGKILQVDEIDRTDNTLLFHSKTQSYAKKYVPADDVELVKNASMPPLVQNSEPPLGLLPRRLWIEQRVTDILQAIDRFSKDTKPVPIEWINELKELTS